MTTNTDAVPLTDEQLDARKIADDLEAEYLAVANGVKKPAQMALEPMARAVDVLRALLSASKPQNSDAVSDLAFSVYSGLNALRWLLNLTTEFDRKDVRTRQAARLLDEYMDSFGKTNRERLEDMWKTLNDKLPDDGRIREYLRAHDAAGRALKAKGAINNNEKAASKPAVAQDECAQDVYKHGQSIGLFDIPKETANVICAGITAVTGARVDWHYIAGRVHMKALTASPAAPAQSGEPVYAYIYEYETAFGLHRQLEPGTYNGSNPTRTVKVYASPQPVAQTERALTDDARDAARYRWLRDPMSEWSTLFAEPIKWDGGGWARISSRWINDYFDKAVDGAIAAQPASGDAQ